VGTLIFSVTKDNGCFITKIKNLKRMFSLKITHPSYVILPEDDA